MFVKFTNGQAEEAQKSVKGMEDNAIHAKYIELVSPIQAIAKLSLLMTTQFAELKRLERDHAKEKQKLVKDKDAGTGTVRTFHSSVELCNPSKKSVNQS